MVSGMEASKTVRSGCGIMIKGVKEKWVTISEIAVPLKVGAAVTGEIVGGVRVHECPWQQPLCREHQSTNKPDLSLLIDQDFWLSVTSESQCGSVSVTMNESYRKVAVACALLNQTSQPNREPTHPGLHRAHTRGHQRTGDRPHETTSSSPVSSTRKTRNHGAKEVLNEPLHQQWRPQIQQLLGSICRLFLGPQTPIYSGFPQRVRGIIVLCLCAAHAQAVPWVVNGLRRVTSIANCALWNSGSPLALQPLRRQPRS